jgi:hypothetical protein
VTRTFSKINLSSPLGHMDVGKLRDLGWSQAR